MSGTSDQDLFGPARGDQQLVRLTRRLAVQAPVRVLGRALRMRPGEWLDRGRALLGAPTPVPIVTDGLDSATAVAALAAGFPVGPADVPALSAWWRSRALADATHAIGAARTLAAEGVAVFGTRRPLGEGFDWQTDPVTERAWWPMTPLDEAAAIAAVRDGGGAVDVKRIWEPGRHQFLLPLAIGAQLAGRPAWGTLAASTLAGWLARNPAGLGIHWASPLEIALRALAWVWAMPWLLGSPFVSPALATTWTESLAAHYAALRGRRSLHTDPTNHLLGELTAVWVLATVFPTLPDARAEAARSLDLLTVEVARQVTVDGVSEEQALGYHAFVLEFLLQVLAVARRADVTLPPVLSARVAAMVTVLDAAIGRGGDVPQLGDWDDGRAMPCVGADDFRARMDGLVRVGAALLDVPVRTAHAAGCGWVRLMTGADAPALRVAPATSRFFRAGGLAVLEADTPGGASVQAIVRAGGFGALVNAGHAHADVLSVLVRVNDELLLADPGCGTYTGPAAVRDTFRATRVHNTVTVDAFSQADPLDVFKWVNLPAVSVHEWQRTDALDVLAASHDGYARLRKPVWHRRDVLFVRPEYLIVVDRFLGAGRHALTRRFVAPPHATIGLAPDGRRAHVAGRAGTAVEVVIVDDAALAVERCPWSSGYGRWERTSAIDATTTAAVPATLVTLLVPSAPGMSPLRVLGVEPGARASEASTWTIRLAAGGAVVEDELRVALPAEGRDPAAVAPATWARRRREGTVTA